MTLTNVRLRELLHYDEATGEFRWRVSQGTACVGKCAGNRHDDGYRYIKIDKVLYRSSRLIWLYVFGEWPLYHIDHINRNTSDDRLCNLREATRSQNLGNRKRNVNNTTGYKGVSKRRGGYIAYINHQGKRIYLGWFTNAEDAHGAYVVAATNLFGEFARVA